MTGITVEKLYATRNQDLELTLLNSSKAGLNKMIHNPELHRPGLAFTGFFDRFANQRVQVIGETEMLYINRLSLDHLREISNKLFEYDVPMIIISKGIIPPAGFIDAADKYNTGVFSSRLTTSVLTSRLSAYLDHIFAPTISVHGTLVDVYGVGLLYTGKAGIGKSEIALDLIERGHRLVADDVVQITRTAPDVVIGAGSEMLGRHMEIRGVGIIDIEQLFGIRSVRLQKRIEVEVHLALWSGDENYDRLGLDDNKTTILGSEIPIVNLPISPGKNITVISEVIAMNHMLKVYGHNSALEFSKKLSQQIRRRSVSKDYLESDYE
ncbi:MAG: HPr(Ser) kinase/phosphatase [candidate division Zixibacteria bacterium]|nr:HPr(Ser) kinase/phosphatase [candidate division Zixibacteria bacterium]